MPRKQTATKETPADAVPAADTVTLEPLPPAEKTSPDKPVYAADPHEKISVNLSDTNGGPEMHLLRSHKYKQMQVRFDHGQPDEQHLKMLADMGWKDRTESEGIFTKQIDPDARWQSVAKMEEEFKQVANAIRKDRGLGAVLEIAT